MPMFNPWVHEKVRPWIYVLFALFFQLSGGIYFSSLSQMVGATSLMREDIQFVAMCGVVGVNMPFLLWSALMLQVIWLFTYGEYYNWFDSQVWRAVLVGFPMTLVICIGRMRHIRHPYIDPGVWPHARLIPILGMFFVAEVMNATPHALQNTLTGGVLHWGFTTTGQFYVFEILGYVSLFILHFSLFTYIMVSSGSVVGIAFLNFTLSNYSFFRYSNKSIVPASSLTSSKGTYSSILVVPLSLFT